jgi:hypothetical protein
MRGCESRLRVCNPISTAIAFKSIVIRIDDYVLDVLMRDLTSQTTGRRAKSARLSHQMVASATGLSKSAVQAGT